MESLTLKDNQIESLRKVDEVYIVRAEKLLCYKRITGTQHMVINIIINLLLIAYYFYILSLPASTAVFGMVVMASNVLDLGLSVVFFWIDKREYDHFYLAFMLVDDLITTIGTFIAILCVIVISVIDNTFYLYLLLAYCFSLTYKLIMSGMYYSELFCLTKDIMDIDRSLSILKSHYTWMNCSQCIIFI